MPKNKTTTPKTSPAGQTGMIFACLGVIAVMGLLIVAMMCRHRPAAPAPPAQLTAEPVPATPLPGSPATTVEVDEGWVAIDPSKIVEDTQLSVAEIVGFDPAVGERGIASDSYQLRRARSYADRWYQVYESYWPRFGSEINSLPGAAAIREYYAQTVSAREEEDAREYLATFGEDGQLWESEFGERVYFYRDYRADLVGDYLSVVTTTTSYAGGPHPVTVYSSDNFNAAGERLTLADIFVDQASYQRQVGALIDAYQSENDYTDFGTGSFTGSLSDEIPFYFTPAGVTLIFNVYELAPYAAGPVEFDLPYADLAVSG